MWHSDPSQPHHTEIPHHAAAASPAPSMRACGCGCGRARAPPAPADDCTTDSQRPRPGRAGEPAAHVSVRLRRRAAEQLVDLWQVGQPQRAPRRVRAARVPGPVQNRLPHRHRRPGETRRQAICLACQRGDKLATVVRSLACQRDDKRASAQLGLSEGGKLACAQQVRCVGARGGTVAGHCVLCERRAARGQATTRESPGLAAGRVCGAGNVSAAPLARAPCLRQWTPVHGDAYVCWAACTRATGCDAPPREQTSSNEIRPERCSIHNAWIACQ